MTFTYLVEVCSHNIIKAVSSTRDINRVTLRRGIVETRDRSSVTDSIFLGHLFPEKL